MIAHNNVDLASRLPTQMHTTHNADPCEFYTSLWRLPVLIVIEQSGIVRVGAGLHLTPLRALSSVFFIVRVCGIVEIACLPLTHHLGFFFFV